MAESKFRRSRERVLELGSRATEGPAPHTAEADSEVSGGGLEGVMMWGRSHTHGGLKL